MPSVISFVLFRKEERISLSLDISGACIAQEFAFFLGRVQRINRKKTSIRPDPIILRESATPAAVRVLKNIILFINRMPNSTRAGYAKIRYFEYIHEWSGNLNPIELESIVCIVILK